MNSKNLNKSEIFELVTSLENQINTNLHELDKYQDAGKLPLHVIHKKRRFLSDIQRLASYTRFLIHSKDHAPTPPVIHPAQIYLSDIIRHSTNRNEREAAREYSISKAKADNPELY